MGRFLLLSLLLFSAAVTPAGAGSLDSSSVSASPEKSQYNLFNPTPVALLRRFSADRPSQSTGPYTVDAGHVYFETTALGYLHDDQGAVEVRAWNALPFNLRLGLTSNLEADFAFDGYLHQETRDRAAGATDRRDGVGDFIFQLKINLFGNDSGPVSFGLIPFVKFPTNTNGLGNDSVEGGLSVPFQASLSAGFTLGLQSGVNFVRNAADTGYDPAFVNAVLLGHTLFTDKLSSYAEFYSVVTRGNATTHAAFFDTGLVYQIAPNVALDLGCNFGLTRAAPDFQPFTGLSIRF